MTRRVHFGAETLVGKMRRNLRVSLWLIPVVSVVAAVCLALGLDAVDRSVAPHGVAWLIFGGQAESARELLSTIAASLLNITALVFSITILVLQLASQQFSPRVLRTFLEDRFSQFAMGMFVGSFVYALTLLPRVRSEDAAAGEFVPRIAVTVAFLLALISVGVLIRYIHHMAHSIRAVSVIQRIGDDARKEMLRLYPELGDESTPIDSLEPPAGPPDHRFTHAGRGAVLTQVDERGLLDLANARDVVIALRARIGQFVPSGAPLFEVWGAGALHQRELQRRVSFDAERTPEQDPAFGFRQLVDVADRALSSGVVDPTTAVQALDQLHDLLRTLALRRIPGPVVRDRESGRVRLLVARTTWDDYVQLAFDEIIAQARDVARVRDHVRSIVGDLLTIAEPDRQSALRRRLARVEP